MNYEETLNYIHSLGFFSLPAGLSRIKNALNKLGNPQKKFKTIHIAGTNGKGSVSVITAEILKKSGLKTGLFVSPYIVDFRERITVNGLYISKTDLCRLSKAVIDTKVKLTEFEFITAVGFLYFAEQNCDIAVLETGLGGRLDATNTSENVLVSCITKIGLDHTALLGDTIEQIAMEKCGIIKNGITVSYPLQNESALKIIKESSNELIIPNINLLKITEKTRTYNRFAYKGESYHLNFSGEHQIYNCITAIEIISALPFSVSGGDIKEGVSSAFIPARLEVVSENPLIVIDGSHNPDGADTVCEALKSVGGEITGVIGMMKDKDIDFFLEKTVPLLKNVIAVTPDYNKRALNSAELCGKLRKFNVNITEAKNVKDALDTAFKISRGSPVFIFGSLYLAAEARKILKDR